MEECICQVLEVITEEAPAVREEVREVPAEVRAVPAGITEALDTDRLHPDPTWEAAGVTDRHRPDTEAAAAAVCFR